MLLNIEKYRYNIEIMDIQLILKALSNEKRLQILQWLKEPELHFESKSTDLKKDGVCVGYIEKKVGLSQSTVSQYLQQLKMAGLITMERKGQWTFCRLNTKLVQEFMKELRQII